MRWLPLLAVAGLLALAGSGEGGAVDDGPASSDMTPYDGPLDVEVSYDDAADVMQRSGAAGLALECTGTPSNGGGADYESGLASTQSSAARAVADWMKEDGGWFSGLPRDGYTVERDDGDWALLSYDVEGATKVAMVVSSTIHDWQDETGWGVYAWAMCDPAELPAAVTDEMGLQIWEDSHGHRVPQSVVSSFSGPEHCGWQDITFLKVGDDPSRAPQFVSDDGGEFEGQLLAAYDGSARLPADAVDTGFQRAGRRLWLAADRSAAYLVGLDDPADVQQWPRARRPIFCD
ncbi:MAG: hypothetical protein U0R80_08515 [Nocardioidaceae bacterium]